MSSSTSGNSWLRRLALGGAMLCLPWSGAAAPGGAAVKSRPKAAAGKASRAVGPTGHLPGKARGTARSTRSGLLHKMPHGVPPHGGPAARPTKPGGLPRRPAQPGAIGPTKRPLPAAPLLRHPAPPDGLPAPRQTPPLPPDAPPPGDGAAPVVPLLPLPAEAPHDEAPAAGPPPVSTDSSLEVPATALPAASGNLLLPRQPLRFSRSQGDRGTRHLDSAALLDRGETTLSFSSSYARGTNVFYPGDSDTLQQQLFALNFGVLERLQLGLNFSLTTNTNSINLDPTAATLGDPHLRVKGRFYRNSAFLLGGLLDWGITTAAQSASVNLGASALELRLLASWEALSFLEAHLNVGAVLDGRNRAFSPTAYLRDKLFAGGAPVSNRLVYGASAAALVRFTDVLDLSPYLEVSGAYGLGAPMAQDPLLASLGVRLAPQQSRRWEFGLGADFRLLGAPERDASLAKMPGVLPWTLFAQGTVHFVSPETECQGPPSRTGASCSQESDCGPGLLCAAGHCRDAAQVMPFALSGNVVDLTSGLPIRGAVVSLSSMPSVRYVTDRSGSFATPPLPPLPWPLAAPLTVQVDASDYLLKTQPLAPPRDGSSVTVRLEMQPAERPAEGSIKGVVLNKTTGKPLTEGFIFLPTLQQRLPINSRGEFSGRLRAGRHQVLIYAKGYQTQRKDISIGRDDVVIFNIDLMPVSKGVDGL